MLSHIKAYQSERERVSTLLHKTLVHVVHRSFVYRRITFGFETLLCLFTFTQNVLALQTGWFGGLSKSTK